MGKRKKGKLRGDKWVNERDDKGVGKKERKTGELTEGRMEL